MNGLVTFRPPGNSIQTTDRAQMFMSLRFPPKTTPRKWSRFGTCQDDKMGHILLKVLRTKSAVEFAQASRLHDMDTTDSDIVTSKFTRGGWQCPKVSCLRRCSMRRRHSKLCLRRSETSKPLGWTEKTGEG